MPLKTLLLNPPSFENFDGGASSRWPATREIESYWYPVWLAYPAGMLEGSKLLDAPPHHVSAEETIEIAKGYEFLVLFTSTVGWSGDYALARAIKKANPTTSRQRSLSQTTRRGPHGTSVRGQPLRASVRWSRFSPLRATKIRARTGPSGPAKRSSRTSKS